MIPRDIENKIRKTILKLRLKYSRLQISEIAEKCGEPKDCIIVVARDMIKNNEIHAEYFKSTRSLVFFQQDNINLLMKKFEEWEKKSKEKRN